MSKSDLDALKSRGDRALQSGLPPLDTLRPGALARVSSVGPAHAGDLAQHGVVEQAIVRIESRAPLRGPLVVAIGRARLAIGAAVARSVLVEPIVAPGPRHPAERERA